MSLFQYTNIIFTLFAASAVSAATFDATTIFQASNAVVSAEASGTEYSADIVNSITKLDTFYQSGIYGSNVKIANVEGGIAWTQHDYFTDSTIGETIIPEGATQDNLYTAHATGTSAIMSGLIKDQSDVLKFYIAYGVAPLSQISFGAVAKTVNDDGSFDVEASDFTSVYSHFFKTAKSDVINSSWGPLSTTANSYETFYMDALCAQNQYTTFVVAAGNEGPTTNSVSSLALSQNGISVGALGNPNKFDSIADYSSRSPSDFYNPITDETIKDVRAAVDITAPGTNIVIGYYDSADPTITGDYRIASGTSFAAPIIAGAVALLKDTSYELEKKADFVAAGWSEKARDTRVIKAVLLNSASKPKDWDNGQSLQNGVEFKVEISEGVYYTTKFDNVIKTNQALDYTYGTGILDGEAAMEQYTGLYTSGTTDNVWLMDTVKKDASNMYHLGTFCEGSTLTATLVWFLENSISDQIIEGTELQDINSAFADLSLEVWLKIDDAFTAVAISDSDYITTEHLSITLAALGDYYLRVGFFDMAYGDLTEETYALAWSVPEPANFAMMLSIVLMFACVYSKSRR